VVQLSTLFDEQHLVPVNLIQVNLDVLRGPELSLKAVFVDAGVGVLFTF
jgi:hypothetical protein